MDETRPPEEFPPEHDIPEPSEPEFEPAPPPSDAGRILWANLPYILLWLFIIACLVAMQTQDPQKEAGEELREEVKKFVTETTESTTRKYKAFGERFASGTASAADYAAVASVMLVFLVLFGMTVAFVLLAPAGRFPPSEGPLKPPPWGIGALLLKVTSIWLVAQILVAFATAEIINIAPGLDGTNLKLIMHGIYNVGLVVALVIVLRLEYQAGRSDFGFPDKPLLIAAAWGVLAVLALQLPLFFIKYGWASLLESLEIAQDINLVLYYLHKDTSPYTPLVLFLVVAGIVPFAEEFLFRGLLYGGLRRSLNPVIAIAASALLFALVHNAWYDFFPLFILGAAFAYLYERTGKLIAPIAAHAAHNAISLCMYYLL